MPETTLRAARILIVDDEPANIRVLERMLSREGYNQLVSTADAREAVQLAERRSPDLILLDLLMPYLDGFAVMERLRPQLSAEGYLPILVLTSDISPETKQRALEAGARDFLTKPFERVELLLRIRNLLEARLLHVQLRQQNQLLEQLYRQGQESLRLRDEARAVIAHDLGQPLTVIRGVAQSLQRQASGPFRSEAAWAGASLEALNSAASDMVAMLGALVDLGRLQSDSPLDLEYRRFDLVELVRTQASLHQTATTRHSIAIEARLPELFGDWDKERLNRVVSNLLINAMKYSPEGGPVQIRIGLESDAAGDWATLSVSDLGIGIPAADLPYVFEPFHRGVNVVGSFRGSGIGLAGVRQIVEQHGGTIEIVSREGEGTTVALRLPLG